VAGVRSGLFLLVFAVSGCAAGESVDAPGGSSDTGTPEVFDDSGNADTGSAEDTAPGLDSATTDSTTVDSTTFDSTTIDSGTIDSGVKDTSVADTAVADTGFDSGFKSTEHVHIYIDNFCKVSVSPTSFTVPAGETLNLTYHNHSVDYAADVWMMYGGGFLDLAKGASWVEKYSHCFGPSASTGYADISIAGGPTSGCPGVRLYIYCK
jgi:hypothetical protein